MQTETLIKTIITIAIIFVVALAAFFIFYPSIPTTDIERNSVLISVVNDFNNNNFTDAIKNSERILKGDNDNIDALLLLASTWAQRGSLEFKEKEYGQKAIDIAHLVLAIDSENSEAYRIIGYANEIMENFDEALKAYNTALKIDPENSDVHMRIGHMYDLQGNIAGAREHYSISVKLGNSNELLQMNLGRMFVRDGDNENAQKIFQKVLDTAVNARVLAEASYMLGKIALGNNDIDNALFLMDQSTKYD